MIPEKPISHTCHCLCRGDVFNFHLNISTWRIEIIAFIHLQCVAAYWIGLYKINKHVSSFTQVFQRRKLEYSEGLLLTQKWKHFTEVLVSSPPFLIPSFLPLPFLPLILSSWVNWNPELRDSSRLEVFQESMWEELGSHSSPDAFVCLQNDRRGVRILQTTYLQAANLAWKFTQEK